MSLIELPVPEVVPSAAAESLAGHLRIHAPREVARGATALESSRSPVLLSFSRHRRVNMPWEAILPAERSHGTTEAAALRAAIERSWGVSVAPVDAGAKVAPFVTIAKAGEFEARWPLAGKLDEQQVEKVPAGAIVLRKPATSGGDEWHWAQPVQGKTLDFTGAYEQAWRDTASLVSVFEPPAVSKSAGNALLTDGARSPIDVPIREREWVLWPGRFVGQRPLELPDLDLNRNLDSSSRRSPSTLRPALEDAWGVGFPAEVLKAHVKRAADFGPLVRLDLNAHRSNMPTDGRAVAQLEAEKKSTTAIDPQEWVLESHGRFYRVVLKRGVDPATIDMQSSSGYLTAWGENIDRLELAGLPGQLPFSYAQTVDLRPQAILEELSRLDIDADLANRFSTIGDALLKKLETMSEEAIAQIDAIAEKTRALKGRRPIVEGLRRTLKERAQRLGYVLPLGPGDEEVDTLNSGPRKLPPGSLYQRFINYGSYNVTVTVTRHIDLGFIRIPIPEQHTYTVFRYFLDAIRIEPEREPWVRAMEELSAAGFDCYRFALTDAGYVSEEGVPLAELMRRAEVDEVFRRKLAVFIPVYQQRLTEGLVLVQYDIIVRPLPGFAPTLFPTLHLEETLSYRGEWRGMEIGELLHSVTLAPGEERTVSISRNVKQATERIDSIVSVLDVTQTQKLDLSDAIENTTRRETTSTSRSDWNVKAGASYGPFSASGGGGGSNEQTSKDFAENVRRIAMQASRELRVNQRQEVRSTTTTSSSIAVDEATSSRIANINQGRTLNLLFHQINNVFDAGVFLDDLKIVFTPSVPLIAGTRIADSVTLPMRDLKGMLDAIARDTLFFSIFAAERESVQRAALRQILQTVLSEYVADLPVPAPAQKALSLEDSPAPARPSNAAPMLRFREPLDSASHELLFGRRLAPGPGPVVGHAKALSAKAAEPEVASVADELAIVLGILSRLTTTNEPIVPHTLITPAAATYLDAALGVVPATEPYSEAMRMRELAMRGAEAMVKAADAELTHARAVALLRGDDGQAMFELKNPRILGAELKNGSLRVELAEPLPAGRWDVEVNGSARAAVPPLGVAGTVLSVPFDKTALNGSELQQVRIIDRATGIYVEYRA